MHVRPNRSNPCSLSSGNTYNIVKLLTQKMPPCNSDTKTNFETPKDPQELRTHDSKEVI